MNTMKTIICVLILACNSVSHLDAAFAEGFTIRDNTLYFPDGSSVTTAPKDGKTILSGSGAPNNIVANPGDFYIDTTNHVFYGPYIGSWPAGFSFGNTADLTGYYTKSQVDSLLSAISSLITLQPPSGLMASTSGTSINLSWAVDPNAISYNIYWGSGPGITKSSTKISNIAGTTFQHTDLTRGNVYFYAVSANYSSIEGVLSPEIFKQVPYIQTNPVREFEPNNTPAAATAIEIGGGIFKGQLSSGFTSCSSKGDYDYYKFTSNGGLIQFTVSTDADPTHTGERIKASIVSNDGATVITSMDLSAYNATPKTQSIKLSANTLPDTYYLMISPSFSGSCEPGSIQNYYYIFTNDYSVSVEYVY